MANMGALEVWAKQIWPQEPEEEISAGIQAAIAANPQAQDEEIKAKITEAASKVQATSQAPPVTPQVPQAPQPPQSLPVQQPSETEQLYKGLRKKYMSPELGNEAREAAQQKAEATATPQWQANVGSALKALGGKDAGAYRKDIAAGDKARYDKAMSGFDDQKTGIMQDVKAIATLDAAERSAQAQDPNSQLSQFVRNVAAEMLPKAKGLFEGKSAQEIGAVSPMIDSMAKGMLQKELKAAELGTRRDIASMKATTGAGKRESTSAKKIAQEASKDYVGRFKSLSDTKTRIANIDDAIAIADKVLTGPLLGKNVFQYIQQLKGEEAQALKHFISREKVELVMEFAQKAGVRAVDTESEKQMLFDSIANENITGNLLKRILKKTKHYMQQAVDRTELEHKYREARPDKAAWGFVAPEWKPYRIIGGDSAQFPMKIRKGGQEATVSNQPELEEAQKEGWQ